MVEPEWPKKNGSFWKHPYFLYIALTVVLFLFLLLAAWIAYETDLIPKR